MKRAGIVGSDYSSRSISTRRRASRSAASRRGLREAIGRTQGLVGASGSDAPDAALFRQRRRRARAARARRAGAARSRRRHSTCRSMGSDFFPSAARRACCGSAFAMACESCAVFSAVSQRSTEPASGATNATVHAPSHAGPLQRSGSARETRRNSRYPASAGPVADRSCYLVRKPPVAGGADVYPARGSAAGTVRL